MRIGKNTARFFVPWGMVISIILFVRCQESTKVEQKSTKLNSDAEKAKFGELLFFDKRLSVNKTVACVTCHDPSKAFTDGETKSKGVFGRIALRNAPTLFNVKESPYFMFDGAVPTLEMQAIIPIQDHNEMGFNMGKLILKLRKVKDYSMKAKALYNRKIDAFVVTRSLGAYQRTLISKKSKFDTYLESNYTTGLTVDEEKGWQLFSQKYDCISCHALPNFTSYAMKVNHLTEVTKQDQGRFRITSDSLDLGKFKIPTLRNIGLTSPYMHDGSIKTLEEVLDTYALNRSKFENSKMKKFQPSDAEKQAILLFLNALTDEKYNSK